MWIVSQVNHPEESQLMVGFWGGPVVGGLEISGIPLWKWKLATLQKGWSPSQIPKPPTTGTPLNNNGNPEARIWFCIALMDGSILEELCLVYLPTNWSHTKIFKKITQNHVRYIYNIYSIYRSIPMGPILPIKVWKNNNPSHQCLKTLRWERECHCWIGTNGHCYLRGVSFGFFLRLLGSLTIKNDVGFVNVLN